MVSNMQVALDPVTRFYGAPVGGGRVLSAMNSVVPVTMKP